MAKIDRLTKEQIQQAFQRANAKPKVINHPIDVILELIRWGVPQLVLRDVIDAIANIDQLAAAEQIVNDSEAKLGFSVEPTDLAVWCRVDPSKFDDDIPAEWEAPPVQVDEDTTRPRKWSEVRMLMQRGSDHYCPCSDGIRYFPFSKLQSLKTIPGVLALVDISDVPDAEI